MLSHLRFHRRGTSNPTSPAPDQASPSPLSSQQSTFTLDAASPMDGQLPSSASSSLPPTLPPITRVTSTELDLLPDELLDAAPQPESRPQQVPRSAYNRDSRFIGGAALRNYVEARQATRRPEPADNIKSGGNLDDHAQSQRPKPALINTNMATRPPPQVLKNAKSTTSFGLVSEPPPSSSNVMTIEPQKGKKGLPFLKNPMSTLLLRRKTDQNPPNILPLPLSSRSEEPTYDPRIKGTRVHDFSAPRRRSNIPPTNDALAARPCVVATERENRPTPVADNRDQQPRQMSNASDPARPESVSTTSQPIAQSSSVASIRTKSSSVKQVLRHDGHPVPPVPTKDDAPVPLLQSTSSRAFRIITQDREILSTTSGSTRTGRSRNVSLSSVPKHMKSTSSRFSFDMIGAAKQEKLLEERHRQRELDKKAALGGSRDSRFDDFDDDAFDYDAMMDDDGLEEKIPGVNADFDDEDQFLDDEYLEEEADPDNDQENFAGFVFQRSNPVSSITSPQSRGMMATPRDGEGKVIGVAMTKDTPGLPNSPLSPEPNSSLDHGIGVQFSGLGIQGMDMPNSTTTGAEDASVSQPTLSMPPTTIPRTINDDELYFDSGMAGFENEFAEDLAAEPEYDSVPFDESIFDNDDTDQFGRPVPGAFALAQSQRHATNQRSVKRESDMMSRLSAQSGISQSTAHTSPSVEVQQSTSDAAVEAKHVSPPAHDDSVAAADSTTSNGDVMAVYQAALAAAAHKAAASGKFERTSSPPHDAESSMDPRHSETQYDDDPHGDYGYSYDDMDDFELGDDAIIAEANASALANDSDGWYGQEFGFYAAPVNNHGSHQSGPPSLEDFGYANGGFFGPKGGSGLNRSASGRVVSREPNLTPITERSEYSNRNSVMSLAVPPMSGTPTFQSPGLAQLAMMADRGDDQITLSALLRLRSRAWGGSQASLVSSKDGSPRSERGDTPSSPRATTFSGVFPCSTAGHARKNSVFSVVSRDSDAGSGPGSPTLTFALPILANGSPDEPGAVDQDVNQSHGDVASTSLTASHHMQTGSFSASDVHDVPVSAVSSTNQPSGSQDGCNPSPSCPRSAKGHQRRKGSADSISYMKEEDSGETRWIMERRRTGESGQVEILEREVVEGGRI